MSLPLRSGGRPHVQQHRGDVRSPRAAALEQVLAAAWPGREATDAGAELGFALEIARVNQVQGALARRYPGALDAELDQVSRATTAFDAALAEACALLCERGIVPVLIKCVPGADHVYSNFDLVVGEQLPQAVTALADWGVRTSGHPLERGKVLVHPAQGPAAHLHREACWWDVPVVDGAGLLDRASDTGSWLLPAPVDELRIWIAHALFQNLAVDLSELLALRPLLDTDLVEQAAAICGSEGWERGFRQVVELVRDVVTALDAGAMIPVPVRLPLAASAAVCEHVVHLARTGRGHKAGREALLRGPLVVAKARRVQLSRRFGEGTARGDRGGAVGTGRRRQVDPAAGSG